MRPTFAAQADGQIVMIASVGRRPTVARANLSEMYRQVTLEIQRGKLLELLRRRQLGGDGIEGDANAVGGGSDGAARQLREKLVAALGETGAQKIGDDLGQLLGGIIPVHR